MDGLADRLAARTLELVNIPSESLHEAAVREHLLGLVPEGYGVAYEGDEAYVVAPPRRVGTPLIVLAGHYDTIPAQDNLPGRLENGVVHGLGAADMKGGLAVALELVRDLAGGPPGPFDVVLVLFGREELPATRDPLPALLEGSALVQGASLAILLEPTAGRVEAGCLGNVVARLTFEGTSGHSGRPWLADNAITRLVRGLAPLVGHPIRDVSVGGLAFRETVSVTRVAGGIADNVIPGEATATLNFRYAPDRTPEEAEAFVRALVPEEARIEIAGVAPPGRVVADAPLVQSLLAAGAHGVAPKLAWTNVADFTERGIDAVNFGPGDPSYAHHADEQVAVEALVHVYDTLRRFVDASA